MTFTAAEPYVPSAATATSHPTQDIKPFSPTTTDALDAQVARMETPVSTSYDGGIPCKIDEGIEPIEDFLHI